MATLQSEFLQQLTARGFIHQCTAAEELDALAAKEVITAYIGFDCTAASLHVGSLVPIMALRILQNTGHRPIVLMGGGTTKVGDPSGKDESRQLLSDADIAANMAGIRTVFSRFLEFGDGPTGAIMADNAEWLDALGYIAFLRDYGRHFSVNRMLGFESVKLRLDREQPLTFLEFNYMVLQAYDFLELARRHDCVLQMGGSDQWGNIVSGVELGRRIESRALYGLTSPLITTAGGDKMGKTAQGAVWLSADKLSPYDYWQYWRNCHDDDTGRFLKLFTDLPLDEIARLEALEGAEINHAKKVLADEATRLAHGDTAVAEANKTAANVFEQGGSGMIEGGDGVSGLQIIDIPKAELETGIAAFDALKLAGLTATNGEARRLIKGGGGRINDTVIESETQAVTLADVNDDGVIKLSAGRKRHALLRVTD